MDDATKESDVLELTSTYSTLTAERILSRFNIQLEPETLLAAMKNSHSLYFQLLFVPFKQIINGIIFQQAYDYQVYAQKLFVDYLVKGNGNDNTELPGENVREDMETNRLKLVELGEIFEQDVFAHKTLIFESQEHLKALVKEMQPLQDTEQNALQIRESMLVFRERAEQINQSFRQSRTEFRALITDTLRLLQLLPNYVEDVVQDQKNRASLYFDDQLG